MKTVTIDVESPTSNPISELKIKVPMKVKIITTLLPHDRLYA